MDNPVNSYVDKSNRQIIIGGDGEDIVAEHNRNEIGKFTFDDNGNIFLAHMNIETNYQRNSIGVEIIKLAKDWYDDFNIIDHLSEEEANFLNYCLTNGIFKKVHKNTSDDRY